MKRSLFLTTTAATALAFGIPYASRAAGGDVSVAYAGSLVTAMEKSIGPAFGATGYTYHGEGKGSVALAKLIGDRLRTPDVFISADPAVIASLETPPDRTVSWYATFASTRMVLCYSRKSKFANAFADVASGKRAWPTLFSLPGITIARTNPALDPKGYRVIFVAQLAERTFHEPGLAERILGNPNQILPEEDALARLETGEVDALWSYSVEAVSRNLPTIELGTNVDLGDPAHATDYMQASTAVNLAQRVGAPILFALTIPVAAPNPVGAAAFVAFFLGSEGRALQAKAGLFPQRPVAFGEHATIPAALQSLLA
jgi:molybdate/tungstate transport system substrate-binding protein